MKRIINNSQQMVTYDMTMIVKSILDNNDYEDSRNKLLELLRLGYINYQELFIIRRKYYKKNKVRWYN